MKKKFVMLIAYAILLSGCVSSGKAIDTGYIQKIKKGSTTEQEIVSNLGNPNNEMLTSEGTKILTYMYIHSQAKASTYIPIVGAFIGGADTNNQILQIWIDRSGVVSNYLYSKSSSETNLGS